MDTNTTKMTVKKYPTIWRLSAGAWCVDVARSTASDAILRQGKPATFAVVTKQTVVVVPSRLGNFTSTRTDVVEQRIETSLGTIKIDCYGNTI